MRTKFRCSDPACRGRMRVIRTTTLTATVVRCRKCNVCGRKLKTREVVFSDQPKQIVSFAEMQREAMAKRRYGNGRK